MGWNVKVLELLKAVEQALGFLKPLNQFSKIADLGCGTGGQTLLLAKYLSGTIIGLDMFSDFIDKLNENARKMKLDNRVTGIIGSMEKLPSNKVFGLNLVRRCN